MKKIFVVSREKITKNIQKVEEEGKQLTWSYDIISIYSKDSFSPVPEDNASVLKLCFDDITDREAAKYYKKDEVKLFTKEQAKEIHKFFNKIYNSIKPLLIHCDAGISRSGAVGEIANLYFNDGDGMFWKTNPQVYSNTYVVRLLKEELGFTQRVWKNKDIKETSKEAGIL